MFSLAVLSLSDTEERKSWYVTNEETETEEDNMKCQCKVGDYEKWWSAVENNWSMFNTVESLWELNDKVPWEYIH